jgi:hypothetical protein
MNLQRKMTTAAGVFLFTAAIFGQQVKTDYDRAANFALYKTYSWEKVQTQDELWVDRIKSAVNTALAAKGWTEVPSDGEVAIVAMGITNDRRTVRTFYDGLGGGWRWGGGFGEATTTVDTYEVGTLVIDLFDARTKMLIWRGSASDTVSNKANKNIKNLDKGVQKMFEHFPPISKG